MARYVFGADVGGTTAKIGMLTESGEKVEFWEIPTRTENKGELIIPDVAEVFFRLIYHRIIVSCHKAADIRLRELS